jgi:DNA-binding NtrC family response regulator
MKHILVVDNDEHVLLVLHDIVERMGDEYEVVAVSNGYEALEKVHEGKFDLLITDLMLSGMNGITLTKILTILNPYLTTVWITAYGCHRTGDRGESMGVYRCLDKPLRMREIQAVVREALRQAPFGGGPSLVPLTLGESVFGTLTDSG